MLKVLGVCLRVLQVIYCYLYFCGNVILVLKNVTDINSVVVGMSLALLTTLYGLILSSLIFVPITNKLKFLNETDALIKEIIMEGVLAIMQGQIPLKVEKLLMSYLSTKVKLKYLKQKK